MQQQTYNDPARPLADQTPYLALQPDGRRWGAYGLVGYRTSFLGFMPFVMVERGRIVAPTPVIGTVTFGLNMRVQPNLVLKADYFYAWFPDAAPGSNGRDTVSGMRGQVAWVF